MATEIPFKDIRVLSFDIFGTLIDWESGIYQGLQASPLAPFLPPSRQQTLEEFERLERAVQTEKPTERQSAVTAEIVRRYAEQLLAGVETKHRLSRQEIEDAAITLGNSIGSWPAFPDTVAAMQRLQQRFKLVPLSNIDGESFARTLAGPLKGCRFDAIYTAEDIGSYKPDPRNFEYLLEHVEQDFGVGKGQLCHVAQSLFHDHLPAKAFGLTSVWIDRKGAMGKAAAHEQGKAPSDQDYYGYNLKVDTLEELAQIVDKATA